ncbi:ABC transporter permease [Lysinibacillus sp. NPDC096418]|uniref:ABC transporter permease n=1 Tax=Lysinibacillus sp. NPDC096418 TaxID=3364138 RepID=UPI0038288D72
MSNLFHARRKIERRNNFKLIASIVDWTVALYIVIPGAIIGFFLYKDFATYVETLWVSQVPLVFWIVLLLLFTGMPTIRTYLQRADRLFLIQNSKQMIQLKRAGFTWTLTKHLCRIGVYLALLAPIFINVHNLTILDLLSYLLLLFTTSFCNALVDLQMQKKWQQFCISTAIRLVSLALFLYVSPVMVAFICSILCIVSFMYYERHFVQSIKHFDQLVELDQVEFYKWQSTVSKTSIELRSMLIPKMKKPLLLWTNSKRMFSRSDYFIEELVCKTMLRQSQYKWGYLRLLLTGLGLIIVTPVWTKFVLLTLLFFGLRSYIKSLLQQIFEHNVWTIFQVTEEQMHQARKRLLKGFVHFPMTFVFALLVIYLIGYL